MKYLIDSDLILICKKILFEKKSIDEWSEIESDDMFQQGHIVGGFDATEKEFCFSVFIKDEEYWLQFPLADILLIVDGTISTLDARKP